VPAVFDGYQCDTGSIFQRTASSEPDLPSVDFDPVSSLVESSDSESDVDEDEDPQKQRQIECLELMEKLRSVATTLHKSSQVMDHFKSVASSLGQDWHQIKSMVDTRWWSLFSFLDNFYTNRVTLRHMRDSGHSLVPTDLVFITDHWFGNLESLKEIAHALYVAQRLLEGEKYVTCSLVIAMIEEIRESFKVILANFNTLQAPRGVKILESVIVEFN